MKIEEKLKQTPAVAQVLIEYEKIYGRRKAREMFDYLIEQLVKIFKSYARSLVPEEKYEKFALADHEIQTLTSEEKQKYYIEVEKRKVWNECREEMLRRIEEDRR